jgi:hypothetical protein
MGGGLMQLVAYGAQDIYLTGNPQITFFKIVYRRHTNFSMESIQQTWSGTLAPSGGSRATATISRNGDLVHRLYLETTDLTTQEDHNISAVLINNVEVEIGGQTIDKHYGHWMEAWAELTELNPSGHVFTHGDENGTIFQRMSCMGGVGNKGISTAKHDWAFIPLRFWFCENPGLALPLIALQYHEVKIILQTGPVTTGGNAVLWADYIYLDTEERRRFAQVSHEYLITQVQHQSFSGQAVNTLNFNHPVKELVWTSAWSMGQYEPALTEGSTFQLKLNGHDRFAARDRDYFTIAQVWQHHSGFGSCHTAPDVTGDDVGHLHGIAVYSFALKPEEHQPSGTCNFSRIDNAQLIQGGAVTNDIKHVFAINYNVLRIMSGMGGLAYSN